MSTENLSYARRPLLDDCIYDYEDGLGDDGLVPPNPFVGIHHDQQQSSTIFVNNQQGHGESQLADDDEEDVPPQPTICIGKLGVILGVIIGVIVQLSALSGSYVNVTIWGTEDGPYATATFLIWCCVMSSVFFVAFYLLRCLVEKSLQMAYSEQEKTLTAAATAMVVDIPSDNPLPNPSGFPNLQSNSNCQQRRDSHTTTTKDQTELLEDVMWQIKLHYVLGVNVGISLSWIVTNLALGDQRVPLIIALAPPALGMLWFWWMKGGKILDISSSTTTTTSQTTSNSLSSSLQEDSFNPLPTIPEEFDAVL